MSHVSMPAVADEHLRVALEPDVADDLVVVPVIDLDQVQPGLDVGARRVVEHVQVGSEGQAVLGLVQLGLPVCRYCSAYRIV